MFFSAAFLLITIFHRESLHLVNFDAVRTMRPSIRLILFAYNRENSFLRLWNSQENSFATKRMDVSIHVMLDQANVSDVMCSTYTNLKSKHGDTFVHRAKQKLGLKLSVMSAWDAADDSEFAIMLEDDVEVSPYFLRFAEHAIRAYGKHGKLMGVSLFHQLWDEVNDLPAQFSTHHNPFLLQFPQSWGAIYFPRAWREFVKFAAEYVGDPIVPNTHTNHWSAESSWKKYAIKYMHERGLFMVYTNFPRHQSLSVHHAEPGTHFLTKPPKAELKQKWMPPLLRTQYAKRAPAFITKLPPVTQLPVYDMHHHLIQVGV